MNLRESINKLLKEDKKHEYGCAMLFFDFPQIKDIHNQIDKNDIYVDPEDPSFGLEDKPHCTLLFGLYPEVTTEDIKEVINKYYTPQYFLGWKPSLFENEYDVLKLDVREFRGDDLHKLNKELSKFPHKESPYEYHPHMTIAYLKKGTGQKYVDKFQKLQFDLKPSYAVYSKPDGTQDKIEI